MRKLNPLLQDSLSARNAKILALRVGDRQNFEDFCCGMKQFKPSRFVRWKGTEWYNVYKYCLVNDFMHFCQAQCKQLLSSLTME